MEKQIGSIEELEAEAARFVGGLGPSGRGATLVTLSGELGAGKTTFTKAAAKALGVEEEVTSPTFVLEKIYILPPQPETGGHLVSTRFGRLVHIDAYRLVSGADLAPLGFDELMHDSGNLVFLEWPERVVDALPPPAVRIALATREAGVHTIAYDE